MTCIFTLISREDYTQRDLDAEPTRKAPFSGVRFVENVNVVSMVTGCSSPATATVCMRICNSGSDRVVYSGI